MGIAMRIETERLVLREFTADDEPTMLAILEVWLTTPFEGGRHERRISLIDGPAA